MKVWNADLPPGVYDACKLAAQKLNTTQTQVIKQAIEWFLTQYAINTHYQAILPIKIPALKRKLRELERIDGNVTFPLPMSLEHKKAFDAIALALGVKKRELAFIALAEFLSQHGIEIVPRKLAQASGH